MKGFGLKNKRRSTKHGKRKKAGVLFFPFSIFQAPAIACAFLLLSPVFSARAEVNPDRVKEVAKGLACLCGDCPRRPLDECACGWAKRNRARIADALEAGQNKEAIIAGFVDEFGQEIFVTPPAEGFNLSAWIMPFLVLVLGAFGVCAVLRNWSRQRVAPVASRVSKTEADDAYRLRLEQELRERDQ